MKVHGALFVAWIFLSVSVSSVAEDQKLSLQEERLQILKYGIESEVLEVVKAIRVERNLDFQKELKDAVSSTKSTTIQEEVLGFFLDVKDKTLEDSAISVLAQPEGKPNSLLLTASSYLTEIQSQASIPTFTKLVTDKNKVLAASAIRALGKLKATDQAPTLVKLLQDGETDPNLKPDLIWSLGEMKAQSAVADLLKEYDDNESQPLLRQTLIEAFGKIADSQAWELILKATKEPNVGIRAASIQALASFPNQSGVAEIVQAALRDVQSQVRQSAASAAATLKLSALKDILDYKVKKDPEVKVRIASLKAIASFDGGIDTVLSILKDRQQDLSLWREALNIVLDQKPLATASVLKEIVEKENKDKTNAVSPILISTLLTKKNDDYREIYGLLLLSDKAGTRTLALRGISVGNYKEYTETLKTLEKKDPDGGVKALAGSILRGWNVTATKD